MSPALSNDWLEFDLSPSEGVWSVRPREGKGPRLAGIRVSAAWKASGGKRRWEGSLDSPESLQEATLSTALGEARSLRLEAQAGGGVELELQWGALLRSPLLIWRATLRNHSNGAIEADRIELLRFRAPERDWSAGAADLAFYSNGWQSWSFSGTLSPGDRFPRTRLGPLTAPLRVNPGTPHPRARGHFSADFYGVLGDRVTRRGVLVGFLSQREAFGTLEARLDGDSPELRLWANGDQALLKPGASLTTDWAAIQFIDLDARDPLGAYLDGVARENSARTEGEIPVGWCSWYYYFAELREKDVRENLEWAAEHRNEAPLSLFQIDDGFEAEVGDWFETNARFAGGLSVLRARIQEAGFRPGLWLAPFVAKPGARTLREHPEWILRGPRGAPANAGFIWNTFTRALDITHPGVREHIDQLIRTACHEWGFGYLKLDFLYAGALPGRRHDPTKTRAQALHGALHAIRHAAGPEAFLVGCGCPLGSGVGVFDSMRISADVAPRWSPAYFGIEAFFRAEPDFASARNAIHNAITRSHLHRRWWVNDPDCLLLRERGVASRRDAGEGPTGAEQHLTKPEIQTLATAISLSAGSLILSDDLPALGSDRVKWLGRLLPPLPRSARALDWFDSMHPSRLLLPLSGPAGEWALVALINWQDRREDLSIDLRSIGIRASASYHVVDFWQEAHRRLDAPVLDAPAVPPHGVALVAIRPSGAVPCWLGDTLHISQGLIIDGWDARSGLLSAEITLGHRGSGRAFLALPGPPSSAWLDDSPVAWMDGGEGVCTFDLRVGPKASLRISWE